jgi:hypothetical protein
VTFQGALSKGTILSRRFSGRIARPRDAAQIYFYRQTTMQQNRTFHGTYCSFAVYRMIILLKKGFSTASRNFQKKKLIRNDPHVFSCGRMLSKIGAAHYKHDLMKTIHYNIPICFFKTLMQRVVRPQQTESVNV